MKTLLKIINLFEVYKKEYRFKKEKENIKDKMSE